MYLSMSFCRRVSLVAYLIVALIMAPVMAGLSFAQEGPAAAGSEELKQKPAGTAGGTAAGVGVSGSEGEIASPGKGAPVPPKEEPAPSQPPLVKGDEGKDVAKGIGASAGTAGTAGAQAGKGISTGWAIAGGVLGLGLLLGLAGGGGGGSTSNH